MHTSYLLAGASAVRPGEYRLLTYADGADVHPGVLVDGVVHRAQDLIRSADVDPTSVLSLLTTWDATHAALQRAVEDVDRDRGLPLEELDLRAPVHHPGALFCTGANYWDHIEEMEGPVDRAARPADPWFFLKTPVQSVVGDGAEVQAPRDAQLDWEGELAVIIGQRASEVPAARAASVIAGYTVLNDLSARARVERPDRSPLMRYDWIGHKCFDGSAPMGPWLTPAPFVADCHDLDVRLWVNDVLKQDSNTSGLVHDVHELIDWLSHQLTLMPGDVIATGTPAGVGLPRGEFLAPGDVVRVEVEGLGPLTTTIS